MTPFWNLDLIRNNDADWMLEASMVNVGVIGLGNVGPKKHIPWIQLNSKTDLVAVADLDTERVTAVTEKHNAPGYTDSIEMIDDEPIEAVHLCTPPQTHLEIGKEVLLRGIPSYSKSQQQ